MAGVQPLSLIEGRSGAVALTAFSFMQGSLALALLARLLRQLWPLPLNTFRYNFEDKDWIKWSTLGFFLLVPALEIARRLESPDKLMDLGSLMLSHQDDALSIALLMLSCTLVAPLYEEICFRGFVQNALVNRKSPWIGILATSYIWATVHASPNFWFTYFMGGVVLGYIYNKSNNLAASTLAHSLWNTSYVVYVLASHSSS
eukprot:CAMPEP_0196663578 /NCGR_PEP_ID=MMETSP1086-20130531/53433_1 /TAXON_ID=77921 /ORGANISM="Cyanoptyche  gloeocystis , Strain SAG4.97" /LENGTH=201 /DNA_ID=CAMNT_0041999455 /DNA_START=388 /DNA_END=993 /DNA_ORIENTATION=-